MIEFEFFDNLIDFIKELYELLKEDWVKFNLFIKENKKNVIWCLIAFITLQFTDVMSLGSSWDKYCKKNNIQRGGSGTATTATSTASASATPATPATPATTPDTADTAEPAMTKKQKEEEKEVKQKADDKAAKKNLLDKKEAKKTAEGEDSVKSVDKKLGFFNKLKGQVQKSAGQHGMAGPVLGNLDGIFGAVGGMFTFAAVILIFFGILSLPVLIFLVITYCIVKKIVGKLALY